MTHIEDLKRIGLDLSKTDGIPVPKLFVMTRKVEKISDLESDRRIANLDEPRVTPKQAFESSAMVIAAFGFIVIAWFAWCQR